MLGTQWTVVQEWHGRSAGNEAGVVILRAAGSTEKFRQVRDLLGCCFGSSSWGLMMGREPEVREASKGWVAAAQAVNEEGPVWQKRRSTCGCGRFRRMWISALTLPLPTPSPPLISCVTLRRYQYFSLSLDELTEVTVQWEKH